jgi:hypothetical protein
LGGIIDNRKSSMPKSKMASALILHQSQCTNQPTVFVSQQTVGCKITVKKLSLSFLVQQFFHLFESYSADVVSSPAARQQNRTQYY